MPPAKNHNLDDPAGRKLFRRRLLGWYAQNKRELPWRKDRDPYRVWLSEIMLQQTRVAAVLDHYARFLRRFPTVKHLAAARESSVLALWSGLGYYRRARMLHAAAKKVVREREGDFPRTSEGLRSLPGIGRYTAAAISSIAFGEAVAVVDGNVERVLQRLHGKELPAKVLWNTAEVLLDPKHPGDFNQAMMELGAIVCTPAAPTCLLCPVREFCRNRGELPQSRKRLRQKRADLYYSLNCRDGSVLLVKRPKNAGLMPSMWELPESRAGDGPAFLTLRHSITVTDYTVRVTKEEEASSSEGTWYSTSQLGTLPLTGLARKILRAAELL